MIPAFTCYSCGRKSELDSKQAERVKTIGKAMVQCRYCRKPNAISFQMRDRRKTPRATAPESKETVTPLHCPFCKKKMSQDDLDKAWVSQTLRKQGIT